MLPSLSQRLAFWIGAGVAVLILVGLVANALVRPPASTRTLKREVSETRVETESSTDRRVLQALESLAVQSAQLEQRVQASERRQADVQTRTVERIERYLPSSATATPSSAPIVVIPGQPAAPSAAPVPISRDPVEIVTRTIEAIDRSRTESERQAETKAETSTTVAAAAITQATESTETRTATETRTETEVKAVTKVASEPERRIGVGVTSAGQPFASYDLASLQLGPRSFGLGKVGAGLFVTRGTAGVDGGPQVNVTPGKSRLFIGAGYALKERQSRLMVGVKF